MLTIIAIILMPLIGLGVAGYLAFDLMKQKAAEEKAKIIAAQIKNGATIFLFKELKILAALAVLLAVIMALWPAFSWPAALAFLIGVIIAGLMAFIGVKMATIANVRTAEQAGADLQNGLSPAFSASAIMGLIVVSLGLLGSSVLYLIFKENQILYVFVFGLSLAALFLRIGGGIFTKSADVSADIVGKLEAGVAEDDLRNPVVIADNVGDIAGDFIGAGADWLSSYAGSLVAAVGLGLIFLPLLGSAAILLPFLLGGAGLMAAALGILLIKFLKFDFYKILNKIIWLASIFMAVISFFIIKYTVQNMGLFWSFLIGLFGGLIICLITEYYTSEKRRPTKALAEAAQSGPSINIIAGLSLGFFSVIMTTIVELAIIYFAYKFGDIYGLALASLGLLSVLGINLAVNTFGPMVDNAAGIVEMAGMSPGIRKRLAEMDASGNTRAAMGKGLAMASATLVALVFLFSFMRLLGLNFVNLANVKTLVGLFIGGLMPFVFSAIALRAIGRGAAKIIKEARRQIDGAGGLMSGLAEPDYNRCLKIATNESLKRMVILGFLALIAPVALGVWLGAETLAGFLIGSILVGFLLSTFMANAGGAWDNAKKIIELSGRKIRTSETLEAAVVGDTIGDPFKDAVGPALNILIKLMAIISLIIIPLLALK